MTASPGLRATDPPVASAPRRRGGLAILATATFVVVTTEMLPVGLLTLISNDLDATRSHVGLLVTAYAFTVGLTAAPLTKATANWPRKRLFLAVGAVFFLGTVLCGLAANYLVLAIGRFLCGTAHGVFWSIVAGYASALAGPDRAGRATSIVFAGNSVALVAGVPLGTAIGGTVGWRGAFCVVAALGLGALFTAVWVLPDIPQHHSSQPSSRSSTLRLPGLRSVVAATALLVLGHFTVYTYFTPLLHDVGSFSRTTIELLLGLYGFTGFLGTWLGGALADRRPQWAPLGAVTLMTASLVLLGAGIHLRPFAVGAIALWGLAFAALPVTLQASVLRLSTSAPDEGSSWYVAAFNLGIGGGALAGGPFAGSTVAALPWVGMLAMAPVFALAWRTRAALPPAGT